MLNVQIVLLGVCCSAGNSSDPLNELSFVQLPGYSISADNVTMCTVSSTPKGRIFLGGSDGHLYEMLYHSNDGWVQKRFSKVRQMSSTGAFGTGRQWQWKHLKQGGSAFPVCCCASMTGAKAFLGVNCNQAPCSSSLGIQGPLSGSCLLPIVSHHWL